MSLSETVIHITANSRLTQTLKRQALAGCNASVIETPQVMTLEQWWQQWQQNLLFSGVLDVAALANKSLSAFESQWLWEQVLEEEIAGQLDEAGRPLELLNTASTAKQLEQAWSLWSEWLPAGEEVDDALQHFGSAEFALFKRVAERYQQRLQALNWQDAVGQRRQRLQWLKAHGIGLPKRFELHGFDEITPAIKAWKQAVETWGCEVREEAFSPVLSDDAQGALLTAHDYLDEARQAAWWCVQQWQHWRALKPPHEVRIGVVAPNVEDYKTALTQALDEQLALNGEQPLPLQSGTLQPLYNISLGSRLSEVPLVQNALLTLRLFLQPKRAVSYAQWSEWLLSPYTPGEAALRHKADAVLRRLQWASFQWPNLLATESAERLPKPLLRALKSWQEKMAPKAAEKLSLEQFATLAEQCLNTLQGEESFKRRLLGEQTRALNSDEHQQREAWLSCLSRFKTLNHACGKQSITYWLGVLQRFVGEVLHQSQSKGLQPIQIMGMLEAGGQPFDALWVLGMTDEAWPRPPQPNPFLPISLQRQQRLPRCDAKRELEYARLISRRLCAAAPVQVWSYPRYEGEAERLMSPILESGLFDGYGVYVHQTYRTLAQAHFDTRQEPVWELDHRGPPIPEGDTAPGGSGILQAQSQCPLMAFIDYRLGARQSLQEVDEGLQSTNQGTLIHEILEHFWQELQHQGALLSLSDEALQEKLQQHIDACFAALQNSFDRHYLELEQQRILELLLSWMEIERQRPAFAVEQTEQAVSVTLAGVNYRLKIDRIDRVGAEWVILDYKTGRASVNDLLKTPIRAPQLAVYLHAMEEKSVAGIGYALLHSDDGVKLNALAAEEAVLAETRAVTVFSKLAEKEGGDYFEVRWEDFLDSLRQEVLDLARQIQQGVADMRFDKPADVAYAAGYLALRLPEVERQLAKAGITAADGVMEGAE
ncbi:PD-(D/E)XK nuclease family protein [Thiomicrorhabdus cannonii]|uniref:PD-(D/E)XK nuclease family protein n=1 Tax=Thiomicrorhabdus cannonii TaxID=2748011 RepID=UPI0015C18543|nr:PD-(D/E)XK nuclease family protein [Thiomicrorhabdus cannonii]